MRTGLVFIMILMLGITGCGGSESVSAEEKELMKEPISISVERPYADGHDPLGIVEGRELMCSAGGREEAEDIAEKYAIELVDYGLGVAVFHTEEDPSAVIERGKKQGLPELSKNTRGTAFEGSGTSGSFRPDGENLH